MRRKLPVKVAEPRTVVLERRWRRASTRACASAARASPGGRSRHPLSGGHRCDPPARVDRAVLPGAHANLTYVRLTEIKPVWDFPHQARMVHTRRVP